MKNNDNGIITLSNSMAECKISLFGGNVLSFVPKSQKYDVFWLGEKNKFDNTQAIRGGVPVCWPRFAEEKLNEHFPRHGFARLSMWHLDKLKNEDNKSEAVLSLPKSENYNLDVEVKLFVVLTDRLNCRMEVVNKSNEFFSFSEALHAYFYVSDKDKVVIKGLKGRQYKSSIDGKNYVLNGELQIKGEFDGAFANHNGVIEIEDIVFNRRIILEKSGSNSTIVWNPNKDLKEMSQGQYKNFVCVEPANQGDCFVKLAPKEKHNISMIVKVDNLL